MDMHETDTHFECCRAPGIRISGSSAAGQRPVDLVVRPSAEKQRDRQQREMAAGSANDAGLKVFARFPEGGVTT